MANKPSTNDSPISGRRGQLAAIGVLAVLLVAVLIFVSQSGKDDNPSPDKAAGDTLELLSKLPQKGTTVGQADAPVTLIEFGDLQCPFCAQFADDVLPKIVSDYVDKGDVQISFEPLTFIGPDSVKAGRVAAALIPDGHYWTFIDLFYSQQQEENTGYVTDDYLRNLLSKIPGVDPDKVLQDASLPASDKVLSEATAQAQKLGVSSTPTLFYETDGSDPQKLSADPADGEAVLKELDQLVNGQ